MSGDVPTGASDVAGKSASQGRNVGASARLIFAITLNAATASTTTIPSVCPGSAFPRLRLPPVAKQRISPPVESPGVEKRPPLRREDEERLRRSLQGLLGFRVDPTRSATGPSVLDRGWPKSQWIGRTIGSPPSANTPKR